MDPTKFLWILSLNAIFLIGRVTEIDGSSAASQTTGVVANLDAVNTTSLQLFWDSELTPGNITIERFVINVDDTTDDEITFDNETNSYNYTITGLNPGVSYNVTLIVVYTQEIEATTVAEDTTTVEATTVVQGTTTVTVLETSTTSAPTTTTTTQSTVLSTATVVASALEEWTTVTLQESIYLFNNTYPATPNNITLIGRDTKSLTFTWNQEGNADDCYMWTDDATMATSNCSFHSDGSATGTISGLPVAGGEYTVHISAVSGGLNSTGDAISLLERTLPPNPSAPQCVSQTNTSFTFMIPPPQDQPPDSFELDEYEVIIISSIDLFPYNTTRTEPVANKSLDIEMTIDGVDIAAGVTYGITLTSIVADVRSAGSSSSNCVTEPNVPFIHGVVDTTEETVTVTWQAPSGYFDGFNVSCFGKNSARNTFAIEYQNQTSSDDTTSEPLDAVCIDVTAGALYEVNVVSILFDQSITSIASESVFNVTVPYAPKKVEPMIAATDFIQLNVTYGYDESDSQCTHFEVSNLTETLTFETTVTIPATNATVVFLDLTPDRRYNFNTSAVSDFTQEDSNFWRRSSNSTPTIAWTLAPSVSNITELERRPWSLLVQFDQTVPHEHVLKYTIHVDAASGRFKTIDLICEDVSEVALHTLNCDPPNSNVQESFIDCGTRSSCDATTVFPETTQGVAEVTTVTDFKSTTTKAQEEITESTIIAARLSEDSTAQSICYNISNLEPHINYSISVQAVNPGGCSVKESVTLITTESIPGCVNITYSNATRYMVIVEWNPPDKPNGIITQYVINITKQYDNSTKRPYTTSDTYFALGGVDPYANYSITVAAETSVGVGESSGCPLSNTMVTTRIARPYVPYLHLYAIDSTSINISWTFSTGTDVETGPKTYYNLTITDAENATWILKEHVEGFYNRSIIIGGLDEYWEYCVVIVAYTIDDFGRERPSLEATECIHTQESTPGPVQLLTVASLSSVHKCYEARVEWMEPAERDLNGIITGYRLTWNETEQPYSAYERNAVVTVEPNEKSYMFTIMATTSVGPGTNVSYFLESTGICRPDPLMVEEVFGGPLYYTQTSFTVTYDPSVFYENLNGPVVASAILVAEDSVNLTNSEVYGEQELFNGAIKWKSAIDLNPIPEYRPTPDSWLNDSSGSVSRRQRRELSATYIVGKDESCSKEADVYCNGPVKPGRNYRIRALICTQQNMCYKTHYLSNKIFITVETTDSLAWIAGVVIGILALIALIVLLLYFLYFKKRRNPYEARDQNDLKRPDVNFPVPLEEMAKPVRIIDFSAHVVEMHRNSDLEFNDEYQSIQTQSARRPWTAAEKPKNRVKNRFVNILPFDHSRVTLRGTDNDNVYDDSESDYINANYITNDRGIREFIACQGPLESTKDDYWQMVWEHDSRVIVMLTNLKERGREKCAQYWPERPNEPSRFRGDINVELISESYTDHYVIRQLKVSAGAQTRDILQFHFVSWPDFGVPDDPERVLAFIRVVRKYAGNNVDPPMIVHCSAGVGRTGTFIVLDRLLRELPRAETIDIFRMVLQLRENRCLMVQTEAQYVFLHDCMKLEIERSLGYNNHNYVDDTYESSFTEESIYQNSGEIDNNNVSLQTFAHN